MYNIYIGKGILDLGTEVSGQIWVPAALALRKEPCYPFDRRLGGPQSRSRFCREEENFVCTGTRNPVRSQSLYLLRCTGFPVYKLYFIYKN
jgi:hypothetical protein